MNNPALASESPSVKRPTVEELQRLVDVSNAHCTELRGRLNLAAYLVAAAVAVGATPTVGEVEAFRMVDAAHREASLEYSRLVSRWLDALDARDGAERAR